MAIKINIGRNVNVVRMPATLSFLRAYAIHDAIVNTIGQIGYDHTAITNAQACGDSPESNAITESPAMSSQKINEPSANTWERINQIRIGLRDAI